MPLPPRLAAEGTRRASRLGAEKRLMSPDHEATRARHRCMPLVMRSDLGVGRHKVGSAGFFPGPGRLTNVATRRALRTKKGEAIPSPRHALILYWAMTRRKVAPITSCDSDGRRAARTRTSRCTMASCWGLLPATKARLSAASYLWRAGRVA